MSQRAQVEAWLATRTRRERRVLAAGAACTVLVALFAGGLAARDDLATLRARVAAHERELGDVRRLAATLRRRPPRTAAVPPADDTPLLGRLEAAAADTVGRERIASMTPVAAAAGDPGSVALRLAGASLGEVVRLLHGLATGTPALPVTRLELRKHPDDPERFDALIEVAR